MKYFDLFSGIGGFHLGMQQAGHQCVGACEIDRYARQVYGKHFPDVTIWEDATKLDPAELPEFDCLVGGFPCQAFSIAGKRRGFDDTRGSLFFEIARIAKERRPQYLLLENVKGLLNHDEGRTFRVILSTLQELGYDAEWQVLNSKYFVPQNRERVFIVGHLGGFSGGKIFPLGDSSKIPNGSLRATPEGRPRLQGQYSTSLQTTPNKGTSTYISAAVTATYWKGWSGDRQLIAEPKTKSELYYIRNTNANMKQRHQSREDSWTIQTSGNEFGIGDGTRIRRLTPLECERLQGFPDNWTAILSDTQRYKCCGNAVTVPVVRYIAEHLVL